MIDGQNDLPAIEKWQTGRVQAVIIPVDGMACFDRDWWRDATNEDASESIRKKNERVDSGAFHGAQLQLIRNPLQILWNLNPQVQFDPANPLFGPPTLGIFAEVIEQFSQPMERWLGGHCPPCTRLGLTVVLAQFADNLEETYNLLNKYLHDVKVDPASRDFQYRVNRPRPSKTGIDGLVINRISTWNSLKINIKAELRTSPQQDQPGHTERSEHICCLLNLDINSSPEFAGTLPQEKLVSLWRELREAAIEIASKGDIR